MSIIPFPGLKTLHSDEPPVPPFHWRLANMGPVKVEVLFDSNGRQVFRDSAAIRGGTYPNRTWKPAWAVGGAE